MAELTREKGSSELIANFGYADGAEVVNDFDSKYPWNSIEEVTDSNENKWVKIPKFYRYMIVEDGIVKGRELSEYKVGDDWKLNHSFVNNAGEILNYVEIAKYQMSLDESGMPISKPDKYPTRGIKYAEAKAAVKKLNALEDGYEYFLATIWTAEMLQDLMVVEFANSYTPDVMSGYPRYTTNGIHKTGDTDDIPYCSGINLVTDQENKTSSMKYRHIENIYGNGQELVDGVFITGNVISVDINGEQYLSSIPGLTNQGMIHQLGYDSNIDLVFPVVLKNDGSYGDYYFGREDDAPNIFYHGSYDSSGYGLYSYIPLNRSTTNNNATYRVVRRLKG